MHTFDNYAILRHIMRQKCKTQIKKYHWKKVTLEQIFYQGYCLNKKLGARVLKNETVS